MHHYQELSTSVEKRMNMEGETINVNNSCELIKAVDTVSILVVDDDTTCLSIVAATLKKFRYEVATVKHPIDALSTLRFRAGAFDLVISDVHMPDMNGFELQQVIAQEFNLPVVLMSADDQEDVVLRGLECGAVFFILKPIFPDDLRDLWQFASMKKKNQVVIEEQIGNFAEEKSVNEDMYHNKDSKRKSPTNEETDGKRGEKSQSAKLKKPKVIWTNSLHNRFLEALGSIGLGEAVPKKILEVMNVPELTRENVASHLQKYRIFLRRVSEASLRIQNSSHNSISSFRSSFTSISETRLSIAKLYKFNRLKNRSPELFPGANAASFLNQGTSSNTPIAQSGFGQSRFLSNQEYLQNPNSETSSLINQGGYHCALARFSHNSYQSNALSQFRGNLSRGSLENFSRGLSDNFDAADSTNAWKGLMNWNSSTSYEVSPQKNNGITSNTGQSNYKYVGYSISNIKKFIGSGHVKNINSTVNDAPTLKNDSTTNVDPLAQNWGASSSSLLSNFAYDDMNTGGDQNLSDVIAECCRTLQPSNLQYFLGNVENGGEIHECNYTDPMFGLAEIFKPTQQLLEECDLNSAIADQVNVQNQPQQMGGENIVTSSSFCVDGTSHWDNRVPSFDQAPNQSEDDDFLESLLVSSPLGKDHTLEGI